jgi:23S rRNA (pseudouridine1915-N3)-methyltransferase
MKVTIAAVGRLKAGAERDLVERYHDRAVAAGRRIGLSFTIRELTESRAGSPGERKAQEAAQILGLTPAGAVLVALDEAGKPQTSTDFAETIGRWRDGGTENLVFAIGGPDGHGPEVLARATRTLALGPMTWPHQIARALLCEQIYRAVTILSGHPYHRE